MLEVNRTKQKIFLERTIGLIEHLDMTLFFMLKSNIIIHNGVEYKIHMGFFFPQHEFLNTKFGT